jgi:hypothetical protein
MILICNDCKQQIFFDPLITGSEGNKPIISDCICIDRDDNPEKFGKLKLRRKIIHTQKYPTYINNLKKE